MKTLLYLVTARVQPKDLLVLIFWLLLLFPHKIIDLHREKVLGLVHFIHTERERTANAIIICQASVQVIDYYKRVLEKKSG